MKGIGAGRSGQRFDCISIIGNISLVVYCSIVKSSNCTSTKYLFRRFKLSCELFLWEVSLVCWNTLFFINNAHFRLQLQRCLAFAASALFIFPIFSYIFLPKIAYLCQFSPIVLFSFFFQSEVVLFNLQVV